MKNWILFFVLVSVQWVDGQRDRVITYGFFAGGVYSSMSNLPDVIVPTGIFQGYTLEEEPKTGAAAGFMINWKYTAAKMSVQTEISYSMQGTDLNYEDINGLNYTINFGYSYLNTGVQLKYYPLEGLYIGVGPYVGFNLNGDNINYSSNAQEVFGGTGAFFETDATVQKGLRESLTGKNHFYGVFSAGYEFPSRISINARYTLGLTDALMTEENGFRYSENINKISSIALSIGYSFDFDDLRNF